SEAPSSTASSHSGVNPKRARNAPSGCYQRRSPAGCKAARCSPTSATSSPPTPAAIQPSHSPERPRTERLHDLHVFLRHRLPFQPHGFEGFGPVGVCAEGGDQPIVEAG